MQSTRAPCAICKTQDSIYTCPRCSLRSCSLKCSTAHKTATGCSGQRDKMAFVPMRDYGYKDMVNDYVFLEEMGRQVSSIGKDISGQGYNRGTSNRGRGRGGRAPQASHREILKQELAKLNVNVDFLPDGMHRRALNKSTWDNKKKAVSLTIEWRFHNAPEMPFTLLTHRNLPNMPLRRLVEKHIKLSKNTTPEWVIDLVERDEADRVPKFSVLDSHQKRYRQLNPSESIPGALRDTSFIEFPTIEISDDELIGSTVVPDSPPRKRRKLDVREGKKAIQGLIGDYGSDDDDESHVASSEVEKSLVPWAESGDEKDTKDDDDNDDEVSPEPQDLLQLVQQLKEGGNDEEFAEDWVDFDNEVTS